MEQRSITESIIHSKIEKNLTPTVLRIENESHMHGGSATDSHFKLTVVCQSFRELSRVKRHQCIYALLSEELSSGVHALALHLYSPAEWEKQQGNIPVSPDCQGGSTIGVE